MRTVLCAIAKCENKYINEWIDWHLNIGFDKIVIYDNNNIDGEHIRDVVDISPNVDIVDWRGKKQASCETQVAAYNDCYKNYSDWDWIMFLDIDEFLEFKNKMSIKDFLSQQWVNNANMIKFHWKCYTDNNYLYEQSGKVTDIYTELCANRQVNKYTKPIYRLGIKNLKITNVHYCSSITGIHYQNGTISHILDSTIDNNINYDCGWIRHYVTKSLEEFVTVKYARRNPGSSKTRLNSTFYFKYNKYSKEKEQLFNALLSKLENDKDNKKTKQPSLYKPLIPNIPVKKTVANNERANNAEPPWCRMAPKNSKKVPSLHELENKKTQDNVIYEKRKKHIENKSEYPFGISICISAWKTAEYIEECLDSVANQTWFKDHDNWEILLGIDGCEETLAEVKEIMHKYKNLKVMMMDHNVGTYVTCNTIMKEAKYEWLLRFDSDDVMCLNMINDILLYEEKEYFDILRPYAMDFGKSNGPLQDRHGCVLIRKFIFEKFGGYKPWKCAADGELKTRLENYVTIKKYQVPVFNRRLHDNNLTRRTDTGLKSTLRNNYKKEIKTPINEENAIIECETTTYKLINNIIVSLTSYPARFKYLKTVLTSILNNTIKPYKICLSLYKDDKKLIDNDLNDFLTKNHIEILVNDNIDIKPHTKYFFTMKKYKNCPIITIDDDVVYSKDLIESLYNSYILYPDCVSARRAHKITYSHGICESYKKWKFDVKDIQNPDKDLFATGVGGVLYPPDILKIDMFDINEILECLYADDIYLKFKENACNVKTVWVNNNCTHGLSSLSKNGETRLYDKNVINNENDTYLEKFKLYE